MEEYIIGLDNSISLTDTSLKDIRNANVVLVVRKDNLYNTYEYYSKIKEIITNNNRAILIIEGDTYDTARELCLLMALYRNYNIYLVEDINIIDKEYIDSLIAREPSDIEISTFINSEILAHSEIDNILLDLNSTIEDNNIEGLKEIIEKNRDTISNFLNAINYMRSAVDKSTQADEIIEELTDKVDSIESSLLATQGKYNVAIKDIEELKSENSRLKETHTPKNGTPVITDYNELQTQRIQCRTKIIIYFKEISPISYISSFVTRFMDILTKLKKFKVKLMIYDTKHSFINNYAPIPIIGSTEYINDRDLVVNKLDKIVAVETNQALIEDVLTSNWDIVIIYDRLKQSKDIVSGNNVYKYWVLNSMSEYTAMKKTFNIDKERIISRVGLFPESLSIQDIPDYKEHTASAKLADYLNMKSIGSKNITNSIIETANIDTVQSR